VVDRERDDAAAAADHADGREAPLELAVGHLRFLVFRGFFFVFGFFFSFG
jgi:hypothetical protein